MISVEALTCYCLGHCHPHSDNSSLVSTDAGGSETPTSLGDVGEIDAGDEGSWCLAKPGARCFSAVEQVLMLIKNVVFFSVFKLSFNILN